MGRNNDLLTVSVLLFYELSLRHIEHCELTHIQTGALRATRNLTHL